MKPATTPSLNLIPLSTSNEYIKHKMAEQGLRQRDLAAWLGGESRVSEILNRKRKLTAKMMKALHEHLGLSAEVLLAALRLKKLWTSISPSA